MNIFTKAKPLSITQAKIMRADGTVEYQFSKPELKFWNLKGRLWVWRRIKIMKKERI